MVTRLPKSPKKKRRRKKKPKHLPEAVVSSVTMVTVVIIKQPTNKKTNHTASLYTPHNLLRKCCEGHKNYSFIQQPKAEQTIVVAI